MKWLYLLMGIMLPTFLSLATCNSAICVFVSTLQKGNNYGYALYPLQLSISTVSRCKCITTKFATKLQRTPGLTNLFLCIKIIDCNVKKSVTTSIRLQATLLHLFLVARGALCTKPVMDPGFLRTPHGWGATYYLGKFSPKTARKWKKFGPGGFLSTLGSATKDQWKLDVTCMFVRCVQGTKLTPDGHVQLLVHQQNMTANWQWQKIQFIPSVTSQALLHRSAPFDDLWCHSDTWAGNRWDRCTILHRLLLVFLHLNCPFIATSYFKFENNITSTTWLHNWHWSVKRNSCSTYTRKYKHHSSLNFWEWFILK